MTIDANSSGYACEVVGSATNRLHDIIIQGIRCQESTRDTVKIKYADRITLRRVTAYDAAPGNYHTIDVYYSTYVLLEDCFASGMGRYSFDIFESQHVTLRRCVALWEEFYDPGGNPGGIAVYGSDNTLIENCIVTKKPTSIYTIGFYLWASHYNDTADNNTWLGNVAYDIGSGSASYYSNSKIHQITGNVWRNNVSINSLYGFYHLGGDITIEKHTAVGLGSAYQALAYITADTRDDDYLLTSNITDSLFSGDGTGYGINYLHSSYIAEGAIVHTYNDLYGFVPDYQGDASVGTGEIDVDPNFATKVATYGKGGYLIKPSALVGQGLNNGDIGAEVLFRYQDGVLTSIPLWKHDNDNNGTYEDGWPMESRICAETGYSVTWQSDCVDSGCNCNGAGNGGGIWKTLEGVYSASDTTPPAIPTGVSVQ